MKFFGILAQIFKELIFFEINKNEEAASESLQPEGLQNFSLHRCHCSIAVMSPKPLHAKKIFLLKNKTVNFFLLGSCRRLRGPPVASQIFSLKM